LLNYLLKDRKEHHKVLIFVRSRSNADRLYESLNFRAETSLIHSGKEQNYRTDSIEKFVYGKSRILIATDVISRGIDIESISTVISFDTPLYPENYIHRIGRTGRAGKEGRAILFYNQKETELKESIEALMNYSIPVTDFPEVVQRSTELTPEEKDKPMIEEETSSRSNIHTPGPSFHEKLPKNKKQNEKKKSYGEQMKERYKKPIRRGDKIQNMKKKNNK
jgi:ATP-dependent RNA helicase RhlE